MTLSQSRPIELAPDGFIRVMPLANLLGIHHQTLRRWWKAGKFVQPQSLNGILLFKNSDVNDWINTHPLCQDSCHPNQKGKGGNRSNK